MREEEQKIIDALNSKTSIYGIDWKPVLNLPLQSWSKEFILHKAFPKPSAHHATLLFRWCIEQHLTCNTPTDTLNEMLKPYKNEVQYEKAKFGNVQWIEPALMESVYALNNQTLIDWITSYFPVPPAYYAQSGKIEEDILNCSKEEMEAELLAHILIEDRQDLVIKHLGKQALDAWYKNTLSPQQEEKLKEGAQATIEDANTPYQPQCSQERLARIRAMLPELSTINTAIYSLSREDLTNCLERKLYSESAVADLYIKRPRNFSPENPRAVTLDFQGAEKTTPRYASGITLTFDLEKTLQHQQAAFYTQTNFYKRDDSQNEHLRKTIRFGSHTITCYHFVGNDPNQYGLVLDFSLGTFDSFVGHRILGPVLKSSLTSTNFQDMQAILLFNFFRFIDASNQEQQKNAFYKKLDELTDEELKIFLTDVQAFFAHNAQLNLYRAHQIDFDALTIRNESTHYSVSISQLVETLNTGCTDTLYVIHTMMPELLQTKRFIQYLTERVTDEKALAALENLDNLDTQADAAFALLKTELSKCTTRKLEAIKANILPAREDVLRYKSYVWSRTSLQPAESAPKVVSEPLAEYVRLIKPYFWATRYYTENLLTLPTGKHEELAEIFKTAAQLARTELLKLISADIKICMGKTAKPLAYIYGIFPVTRGFDGVEDINEGCRKLFTKLVEECEAELLKPACLTSPLPEEEKTCSSNFSNEHTSNDAKQTTSIAVETATTAPQTKTVETTETLDCNTQVNEKLDLFAKTLTQKLDTKFHERVKQLREKIETGYKAHTTKESLEAWFKTLTASEAENFQEDFSIWQHVVKPALNWIAGAILAIVFAPAMLFSADARQYVISFFKPEPKIIDTVNQEVDIVTREVVEITALPTLDGM